MIILHPRLIELSNQPVTRSFLCVRVKNIRLTDYPTNLTLSDGVYTSSDAILAAEEPQLTSTVDRDLYKISFADPNRTFLALFEAGLNGAEVSVRQGLVDYYTGEPETSHLLIIYEGIVESYNHVTDTSVDGSIVANVVCSNLMASLDDSNPYYTSKNYVKTLVSSDTSYDQLYEGSGSVVLRWGKKE